MVESNELRELVKKVVEEAREILGADAPRIRHDPNHPNDNEVCFFVGLGTGSFSPVIIELDTLRSEGAAALVSEIRGLME